MAERHVHFDLDEETWIRVQQRAAREMKTVAQVTTELLRLYAARAQDPSFVDVKAVKEEIRRRNRARIFRDEG